MAEHLLHRASVLFLITFVILDINYMLPLQTLHILGVAMVVILVALNLFVPYLTGKEFQERWAYFKLAVEDNKVKQTAKAK